MSKLECDWDVLSVNFNRRSLKVTTTWGLKKDTISFQMKTTTPVPAVCSLDCGIVEKPVALVLNDLICLRCFVVCFVSVKTVTGYFAIYLFTICLFLKIPPAILSVMIAIVVMGMVGVSVGDAGLVANADENNERIISLFSKSQEVKDTPLIIGDVLVICFFLLFLRSFFVIDPGRM